MSPLSFTLYVNSAEEDAYIVEATNDSGTGNILGGAVVGSVATSGNMRFQQVQVSAPIYSNLDTLQQIGTVSASKITNADGLNVVTATWTWTFTIPNAVNGIPSGSFTVEEFLQNYTIGGASKKQVLWGSLALPTYASQGVNPSEYVPATSCGSKFPLIVLPAASSGNYFDRSGVGYKVKASIASCALPSGYRSYTVEFEN